MGDISETSADHAISLDPLVASRIEVVRGPASLLYGSSALGGVINLMTTDIPDDWDPGLGVLLPYRAPP
jgi:iron complex outermembrane recepter protein